MQVSTKGPSIKWIALSGKVGVRAQACIYCFHGKILLFRSVQVGRGHSFFQDSSNWNFKICPPPFLFVVPSVDLKYPSPPPFNLCITGLPKLTTNTLSACVIRCNTNEQKQASRSKLMFQIHKKIHSVHNHIPNLNS